MALREVLASFGIEVDSSKLEHGEGVLEGMIGKLKGFAGVVGGAFAVKEIWEFVESTTASAVALLHQSETLGVAYGELKQWNYAAEASGVSTENLSAALRRLSGGKGDKALAALGVSAKDASGQFKPATDLLDDVSAALVKIDNPAERNRKAMAVLGKNYAALMPLLNEGAEGLKELREEYVALGGGTSDDFAKKSEEQERSMKKLQLMFKLVSTQIVVYLLPGILSMTRGLVDLAKIIVPIIKNSKLLEAGFLALGLKGIALLSGQLGGLGSLLKLLGRQFLTVILPLLILEDFLVFLAGGRSLFGEALTKAFGKETTDNIRASIVGMVTDFKNVLGNGHFWDTMVLAAKIALVELNGAFASFGAMVADVFANIWNGVISGASGVVDAIGSAARALGLKDIADQVDQAAKSMDVLKAKANAGEMINHELNRQRLELAAEGDRIGLGAPIVNPTAALPAGVSGPPTAANAEATNAAREAAGPMYRQPTAFVRAPAGGNATTNVNTVHNLTAKVDVHVEGRVEQETAERVGKAAQEGTSQALNTRAAQAALKPGGGK